MKFVLAMAGEEWWHQDGPAAALRKFLYLDDNEEGAERQKGPAMLAELQFLRTKSLVSRETMCWTEGMDEWKPMGQVPFLEAALFTENEESKTAIASTASSSEQRHPKRKRKRKCLKREVTAVYVAGIPKDATVEEVRNHFSKCGIIQVHPTSKEPCVKLYKEIGSNLLKGDGLVVYKLRPSVENAIKILHESELRLGDPSTKLSVEEATKQPSFAYDEQTESSSTSNLMARALKMRKLEQQQMLSWNEEGVEDKDGLKVVVLKNLFNPKSDAVRSDPTFFKDLEKDIIEECNQSCGAVKKVTIFPEHEVGVAVVRFRSARAAELCIETMHERWFDERRLVAEYWDGVTDFRPKRTEEEENIRIEEFASAFEN